MLFNLTQILYITALIHFQRGRVVKLTHTEGLRKEHGFSAFKCLSLTFAFSMWEAFVYMSLKKIAFSF